MVATYYNRGKCRYLVGRTQDAFRDFQQMILIDIDNPALHIEAGNLLMTTGNYKDAISAYSNAQEVGPTAQALY